jgi:Tol biopolymer transport system component
MEMKQVCRRAALIGMLIWAPGVAVAQDLAVLHPRALLINFDPIIESRSNQRLHTVGGWNDPSILTSGYISDFQTTSHGLLMYRLTRTVTVDVWPIKEDGFRYTDDSYLQCLSTWSGWHTPDLCDYKAKVRDFDLARKVDSGEIEEVLDHSAPYFGGYETRMIGRGGYWCNSPALTRVACSKIFIVSVFNYERGVGEMLEDFGHRTESIMRRVYGSWAAEETHAWNRFTLYDKVLPGKAQCGNVHYAPNSNSDYDWGSWRYVDSTADYWLDTFPAGYPDEIPNFKRSMNCSEWGYGDIRLHHKWWYLRIPHAAGSITEYGMTRLNNWWAYLQDFNTYPESGGDHVPGGPPPAAETYPGVVTAVSANLYDDWAPQINATGRLVWHGYDGSDFEIYSANVTGTNVVRITTNAFNDEDPKINAAGRIVWQGFDGQDYEIYSANADGTNVVRITNNTVNDWHPQINDLGKVVWDSFDGTDYEIYSANADGTDVVRITNNSATSGYPREDVWPQINNSNRVVWFGHDGSDWEIYSANADGTNLVNVSNNSYEDEYPQINESGRVVWHTWYTTSNAEIHSADATGGTVLRLTNNSYEDWYPQISDAGQVVWMARPAAGWEIMRANAAGGGLTQITNNSTHDQYPQINLAGEIVWQGFDGADWEIYTLRDGAILQVTNNDYHDRAPCMNDESQIAWHADSSENTSEIFSAVPVIPIPGDFNGDRDVDLEDFGHIQTCLTGSGGGPVASGCEDAILDYDTDVDTVDLDIFVNCLSGTDVQGDPACAG